MPGKVTKKSQKVSEYEEKRQQNVADNKAMLAKLMEDLKDVAPLPTILGSVRVKKSPKKKRTSAPAELRRNPSRSVRYNPLSVSPRITRSRARRGSLSSDDSSNLSSPGKDGSFRMRLDFFGARRSDFDAESLEGFSEEFEDKLPRRRHNIKMIEREVRSPDDITEEDLKMVAETTSEKVYDTVYGSTCHQCRQKTIDMKTICHNKMCQGVRGQFCGPCLRNRYGEDVRTALKNEEWVCPPCRGVCNCSFCRRRSGKHATGILIHLAREYGYDNVAEYLDSFKKKD